MSNEAEKDVDEQGSDTPTTTPKVPASDEKSWGYPAFARSFPANDDLARLVDAFARGDYATVRTDAPKLAASTDDDAVKKAAQTLRERIEPDPTSRLLFLFAAALLAFLTVWWVAHDGPEGGAPPPLKPATAPKVPHVE